MSTKKIYDLTPKQREIALWRDAKRKQLRELYLRDSAHPTKSLLFDTGIYKYAASKASIEQHFVPTLIRFVSRIGILASFVIITAVTVKNRKDKKEHLYRTGQIDYASRSHRFC